MYRCNKIKQRLKVLYANRSIRRILTIIFYLSVFLIAWQYRASKLINIHEAPTHNLISLNHNVVRIPKENKATLLYFFAPWCSVCQLSMENFNDIAMGGDYSNIQFIAVAQDWASQEDVENFIQDKLITTQVAYGTIESKNSYQIKGYPTYYLIDHNGQIISGSFGYSSLLGMKAFLSLHTSSLEK